MIKQRKKLVARARRIVVKAGSAVLAGVRADTTTGVSDSADVCLDVLCSIAKEISTLRRIDDKREFTLVSSGAVAMGMQKMDLSTRPAAIPERQAIAALGQTALMGRYEDEFAKYGQHVAQVLLTQDDLANRKRFLNARNALSTLRSMNVIPIINENDTVAVDEIKFGDNDNLSALVTNLVEADLLIILTDIDSIFDKDPKLFSDARRLSVIEDIDNLDLEGIAQTGSKAGAYGTGGILSKIAAAKKASHFGTATIIANGFTGGILEKILSGEDVGTFVPPMEDRLTSKKHWIAYSTRPSGRVFVDDGARSALLHKKKSLLPSGITGVDGTFDAGEVIHCVDKSGMEFARGVVNYSSSEIERLKGLKTDQIEKTLGYRVFDEIIHRDNLVVL